MDPHHMCHGLQARAESLCLELLTWPVRDDAVCTNEMLHTCVTGRLPVASDLLTTKSLPRGWRSSSLRATEGPRLLDMDYNNCLLRVCYEVGTIIIPIL